MNAKDYINLFTDPGILYQIVNGILEAQLRDVDYSDLWLDKKMINLNSPTLIRIGEDIPLSYLYHKANIKWIAKFKAPIDKLKKDTFFLWLNNQLTNSYFDLFEWPSQNIAPLLPKTDIYLYKTDDSVPMYECEEVLLNAWGLILMKKFPIANASQALELRLKLFEQSPTATNTILIFQIMEAIITDKAKSGLLDSFLEGPGEKTIDRFEKLKNLALGTNQFEERKLAVTKCHQTFQKLIGS